MVITPFLFCILAILNGFFRAPLQTRKTLLTRVLPYGLSCEMRMFCAGQSFAHTPQRCISRQLRRLIHLATLATISGKSMKNHVHNAGPFLRRHFFFIIDYGRDVLAFSMRSKLYLLLFFGIAPPQGI